MVDSIINSIIEAENSANAEIRAAGITAKEIIFNAETEKDNIREASLKEVKTLVKAIITDAERTADTKSEEIINAGIEQGDKLVKSVSKKTKAAVDKIVRRVVSKYGNS